MNAINLKQADNIFELSEEVHRYINTAPQQKKLTQKECWDKVCSSLDTNNDALTAIYAYSNANNCPISIGLKYIYVYGILQILYVQQDAISNLSEAFDINYTISKKLTNIRHLRNASIGHPSEQKIKDNNYYNCISRVSLNKTNFQLITRPKKGQSVIKNVNLISCINDQLSEIKEIYENIVEKLKEDDIKHKKKYKNNPLKDILNSKTISYCFQNIEIPTNSSSSVQDRSNIQSLNIDNLKMIKNIYKKFEKALKDRDEMHPYTEVLLRKYFDALSCLEKYFKNPKKSRLTEKDADVYLYYIIKKNDDFMNQAKTIDEE